MYILKKFQIWLKKFAIWDFWIGLKLVLFIELTFYTTAAAEWKIHWKYHQQDLNGWLIPLWACLRKGSTMQVIGSGLQMKTDFRAW